MKNSFARFLVKRVHRSIVSVFSFLFILAMTMLLLPGNLQKVYAEEGSIYLNGEKGNDNNDGETEETAVKTFKKAKEMAIENPDISIIYVSGKTAVSGELSLEGSSAILKRAPGYGDYLLEVAEGEELTLQDVTIDGGEENENKTRKSLIYVAGTLNIEEGTILENNRLMGSSEKELFVGGAIFSAFSDFKKVINMNGGIIRHNFAYMGGGVFLGDNTTINMSGGTISGNEAGPKIGVGASGGGIAAYESSEINLSGDALITENKSEELGGGISLGTAHQVLDGNTLNMNGGIISENIAGSSGGGIFIQATKLNSGFSTANIFSGQIINNTMSGEGYGNKKFGGGGIYVNGIKSRAGEKNGVLNLYNAVIKDNTAQESGGGYAACPVTLSSINVKKGVAIYGNHATLSKDIDIESGLWGFGEHNGSPVYSISAFMLGGTPYNWKLNNNQELPLNKLSGVLDESRFEFLGLHTDVTEDSSAENLADVLISGNVSMTKGGGIGSNGTVNMGDRDIINIKVKKIWEADDPNTRPKNITVELYRKNEENSETPIYIGSETISEINGEWDLSFNYLPKNDENDNPYLYFIKERPIEGYYTTIKGDQKEGFTIVNSTTPPPTPNPNPNPDPRPNPDPDPNPNPNPRPNPSPNPGPTPDPNPTPTTPSTSTTPPPTVAGIFKPIPTPSEIVENSPAPEVLGEYRPAAVKNKRNIPTEDASHLLLWASLFGISGTALLVYIAQKSRRIRRRKTIK